MNWLIYALGSASLGVGYALVSRKLSVKSKNPRALSIVFNSAATLIALSLFVFDRWEISPISLRLLFFIFLGTVLYAAFEGTHFYARRDIDASTFSILARLYLVVAFVGSIIFLGELVTVAKLVAAILILVASFLVVVNKVSIRFSRGLMYAAFAFVALGLARVVDRVVSVNFPLSLYTLVVFASTPLYLVFIPPMSWRVLRQEAQRGSWKIILLAAINVTEFYLLLKALSLAEASKVVPVVSISTVLTVLAGVVFLNERQYIGRKILAGFLAFGGVIIMGQ